MHYHGPLLVARGRGGCGLRGRHESSRLPYSNWSLVQCAWASGRWCRRLSSEAEREARRTAGGRPAAAGGVLLEAGAGRADPPRYQGLEWARSGGTPEEYAGWVPRPPSLQASA